MPAPTQASVASLASSEAITADPGEAARSVRPKSEAMALLSQVMVRLHGVDVPVVQFIQASPGDEAAFVPRSFAEASTARFGRTLLVTVRIAVQNLPQAAKAGYINTGAGRRRIRKADTAVPDIVPDSTFAGLYHAVMCCAPDGTMQNTAAPPANWLRQVRQDFRVLVVACGPPHLCSAAVPLAARCHGSVLSVAAGVTRLPELQALARRLESSGGKLLGSVLYGASTPLTSGRIGLRRPRWAGGHWLPLPGGLQ